MDKRHLGDGVYIDCDGAGLTLTTEYSGDVSNTIYLNPDVINAMTQFNRDVASEIRAAHAKNHYPAR